MKTTNTNELKKALALLNKNPVLKRLANSEGLVSYIAMDKNGNFYATVYLTKKNSNKPTSVRFELTEEQSDMILTAPILESDETDVDTKSEVLAEKFAKAQEKENKKNKKHLKKKISHSFDWLKKISQVDAKNLSIKDGLTELGFVDEKFDILKSEFVKAANSFSLDDSLLSVKMMIESHITKEKKYTKDFARNLVSSGKMTYFNYLKYIVS